MSVRFNGRPIRRAQYRGKTFRGIAKGDSGIYFFAAGDITHTFRGDLGGTQNHTLALGDGPARIDSVVIAAVSSVDEASTFQFRATVRGTYDTSSLAWSLVSGSGSMSASGLYQADSVATNDAIVVRVTATVRGTGANALAGTSDTASDDESFTVTAAPAPSLTTSAGAGEVRCSWSRVPGAADYDLQYKLSSSSSWRNIAGIGNITSYTVSGLTNGSSYDFRVRANDPPGSPVTVDTSWSGTASATPVAPPTPRASVTVVIDAVSSIGEASTFQFRSALTGDYDVVTAETWSLVSGSGSMSASGLYQADSVASNDAVVVRVDVAVRGNGNNAVGGSTATDSDTERFTVTAARAPALVATTSFLEGAVDCSWSRVPGAADYDLQYKLSSSSSWRNIAGIGNITSHTVTGLAAGLSYDFRVRANDPSGAPITVDTSWSGAVSAFAGS